MPVILLTARVQEADVSRGFEAGADDYLRKPFSPQELRVARAGRSSPDARASVTQSLQLVGLALSAARPA